MDNQLDSSNWNQPPHTTMDNMGVDDKYALKEISWRKLNTIPASNLILPQLSAGNLASPRPRNYIKVEPVQQECIPTTEVVDHSPKAVNLSHIPPDLRLDFMLKNQGTIDKHSRLAIKESEKQHIDITRAIYFWRFDDLHQFQRYHDSARWNIALFVALLTDERCSNSHSAEAKSACEFLVAYLAAVLEHHNDPAVYNNRESFVSLWKSINYDFFTFNSSQKHILKKEMKRLTKEWKAELERIQKGWDLGKNRSEVEANYNAKIAQFVGVLIPGTQSQRSPNHCASAETTEDLKQQSGVRAEDMPKGALVNALDAHASGYSVPKTDTKSEVIVDPPEISMDNGTLGFPLPDATFLHTQAPKPEPPPMDWPALHPPNFSPLDLQKNVAHVVDKKAAIWVLRESRPRAMLAKLMELFPEKIPVRGPPTADAAQNPLQALPSTTDNLTRVMSPTFENSGAFVTNNVMSHKMGQTKWSNPGTNMSPTSYDNQHTKFGKRSRGEQNITLDEPKKKRIKE